MNTGPGEHPVDTKRVRHTLELKLSELHHLDRPIVVSQQGVILDPSKRDEFYKDLFASLRRSKTGEIEIRGGKISENGLFTADSTGRILTQITAPIRATSGQQIILARQARFTIPSSDGRHLNCPAEQMLFELREGQKCIIGRNEVHPIHTEISVQHLTAIRLRDSQGRRVYRIIDGILPSTEYPLLDLDSSEWFEALDWTPVGTGRRIKLGKQGCFFRIPFWKRDPVASKGKEYYFEDIPMRVGTHYLVFPVLRRYLQKVPLVRHSSIELVQHELYAVMDLIAEQRLETAHAQLLSTLHFSKIGLGHLIDDQIATFSPTGDLQSDAQQIDQIFSTLSKTITPCEEPDLLRIYTAHISAEAARQVSPDRLKDIQEAFFSMLVPFEIEQWCYTYQNLLGGFISKRGSLADGNPFARQLDVTLFLQENGIELFGRHLRLYNREKFLSLLDASKKYESAMECARSIFNALSDLSPGQTLTLSPNSPHFSGFSGFPSEISSELSGIELSINQLVSGHYRLSIDKTNDSFALFARNSGAIWERVADQVDVHPGATARLGRFLEITLP